MKFKISISAEVDFTEMLMPENIEGAKLALGTSNEMELIKKFSENFLANTQLYASNFRNVGNVVGDISRIESDKTPQVEHQMQEADDNEVLQEVDFRETMRKIREYQEQQQQQQQQQEQDPEGDILSDEYLGNYVGAPSLNQDEPDRYYAEDYNEVEHYNEDEPVEYCEGKEISLESTESEESSGTKNRYTPLAYAKEESVAYRLNSILRDIKAQGYTIDSIVVDDLNLKDHILENDRVIINKDSIIVREDLETDFVIRYIDETNNIAEVV